MKLSRFYIAFALLSTISVVLTSCLGVGYGYTAVPKKTTVVDSATNERYKTATVSVDFFPSYASLAAASLPATFTEDLRNIFLDQSQFQLVDKNGDMQLKGAITGYDVRPIAIQANETAANNRLTITVKVTYTNAIEPDKGFEQTFSRFADFEANQTLSDVEDALIVEIDEQLVQDIFNRTLGDW